MSLHFACVDFNFLCVRSQWFLIPEFCKGGKSHSPRILTWLGTDVIFLCANSDVKTKELSLS
jgi:hypothetical protein